MMKGYGLTLRQRAPNSRRPFLGSGITQAACLALALALTSAGAARADVLRLTNDRAQDRRPQLNDAGQVLWEGGSDLYLWTSGGVRRLTQSPRPELHWALGEGGHVVWVDGVQVVLWDGAGARTLPGQGRVNSRPSVNRAGHVVWEDTDGHIYFWDGALTRTVPTTGENNGYPLVNDADEVLWLNWDGTDSELFLWDGAAVRQISNDRKGIQSWIFNQAGQVGWEGEGIYLWDGERVRRLTGGSLLEQDPALNHFGQVAWLATDGRNPEIFFWDGATVRQLSRNGRFNGTPHLNNAGQVVWESQAGRDSEILFWDDAAVRRLSSEGANGYSPQINDAGQVVWLEERGGVFGVVQWDGAAVRRLSASDQNGSAARLNSAGQVVWVGGTGEESEIYLYTPTEPGSLALHPGAIIGGRITTGVVTLPSPAPTGGAEVLLTSDHPAARVPAHVLVPAGQSTVTFPVETTPVPAATPVRVTAGSAGAVWRATLRVEPPGTIYFRVEPGSVTGSLPALGTVALNGPAPVGGAAVILASDNPALAGLPPSVTVPAGALSVRFPIRTAAVTKSTPVNLAATAGGVTKVARLLVTPVRLVGLSFQPATVSGSDFLGSTRATATVTLSGPAPEGGAVVGLTSEDVRLATVPDVVTVPSGAVSVSFYVTTYAVAATAPVEITARYGGVTERGTLVLTPPMVVGVSIRPERVVAGERAEATVTLDGDAPHGGVVVMLESASPAAASVPARVTVPIGADSVTFPVETRAVEATTEVTIRATVGGVTRAGSVTVLHDAFSVAVEPRAPASGTRAVGTITLSRPAPNGGALVTVTSRYPHLVTVPERVPVPEGRRTATFTVLTTPEAADRFVELSISYEGVTKSLTLTVRSPLPTTLVIEPAVIVGGETVSGTVVVDGVSARTVWASLFSPNPEAVTVPSSVIVPAGASSVTFPIQTRPVAKGVAAAVEVLTPRREPRATLMLLPAPAAPSGFTFSVLPGRVTGGATSVGAVALGRSAPPGGRGIGLSTGSPAVLSLPRQVVVPAGATVATFPIATRSVTEATLAPIWAAAGEVRTAHLWVLPIGLSLTPNQVQGGKYVTGTIVLPAPAEAGGYVVRLSSSDRSVATVTAGVQVPPGETTLTFGVKTAPVATPTTVVVTATYGQTSWTRKLTVTP
jgi:hypothetical protein